MGSVELAVLLASALVGLALGAFIAWASRLAGTGHPPKPQVQEVAVPTLPDVAPERGTARALFGALLAVLATTLVALFTLSGTVGWMPPLDDLPGGALTIAFAVLIVAVVFATPTWLGVRR